MEHNMKISSIARGVLIGLCTMALTGCGAGDMVENSTDIPRDTTNSPITEHNNYLDETGSDNANDLINSSTMQGSVIEFSDRGCTVSQVIIDKDEQIAMSAAPGSESADTTVTVQYEKNCIFQIAVINIATEKATVQDASISDIKKQTSLHIYGEFEDSHTVSATKIMIVRYE